jgi:hypothetical protein
MFTLLSAPHHLALMASMGLILDDDGWGLALSVSRSLIRWNRARAGMIFRLYDADGDGALRPSEYLGLVRQLMRLAGGHGAGGPSEEQVLRTARASASHCPRPPGGG